jgi:integrase/recombinase XerD
MTILPSLIERFFKQRLMQQRNSSSNTIASYRDTFRLLLKFAEARLHKQPSRLELNELDAPFVAAFLEDMESGRGISARTRNLRLTAIRSFFRFVAFTANKYSASSQFLGSSLRSVRCNSSTGRRLKPSLQRRTKAPGPEGAITHFC